MPSEVQYDIFVSHSLKDEEWVNKLTQLLSNCGLKVFIFEKEIKFGESIPRKINKVLEECSCLILIMTQDWVDSEWSNNEAHSTLFDDPNNKKRKVIPVLLKDCKIPITLRTLRYLDFKNEEKFDSNFNCNYSGTKVNKNTKGS